MTPGGDTGAPLPFGHPPFPAHGGAGGKAPQRGGVAKGDVGVAYWDKPRPPATFSRSGRAGAGAAAGRERGWGALRGLGFGRVLGAPRRF